MSYDVSNFMNFYTRLLTGFPYFASIVRYLCDLCQVLRCIYRIIIYFSLNNEHTENIIFNLLIFLFIFYFVNPKDPFSNAFKNIFCTKKNAKGIIIISEDNHNLIWAKIEILKF